MTTKPDLKLGQKIREIQERDAVHVAVIPVRINQFGNEVIKPGTHVGFIYDEFVGPLSNKLVGIIDPFLSPSEELHHGDKVWLFLYPNTVTSIRHYWEHPDITVGPKTNLLIEQAVQRLRSIAESVEISFPELIDILGNYIETGKWHTLNFDTPDIDPVTMWDDFQLVTGVRFDKEQRKQAYDIPFTCAC